MKEWIPHRADRSHAELSPLANPMPEAQGVENDNEPEAATERSCWPSDIAPAPEAPTQIERPHAREAGKIGWALLWLLGIPLPVLLLLYLLKGCSVG